MINSKGESISDEFPELIEDGGNMADNDDTQQLENDAEVEEDDEEDDDDEVVFKQD